MNFNGGKMQHVFQWEPDHKSYQDVFTNDESKEALEKGELFVKIDGSNHCFIKQDDVWVPHARLDDRGKDVPGTVALPDGSNASAYGTHRYTYRPLRADVSGKSQKRINARLLELTEAYSEKIDTLAQGESHLTFEAVGRKFQRTPGVDADVHIAVHCEQELKDDVERSFSGVRDFLEQHACEGVVVKHDGLYWKILSKGFGIDWRRDGAPGAILPVLIDQ